MKTEREELLENIQTLLEIDTAHPNLPDEYKDQLQREIDFKRRKLSILDAKNLLTGDQTIDNRVSIRANKNK